MGQHTESQDQLTESEREDFNERAGILEFDAKMSREDAERIALAAILAKRTINAPDKV